MRTKPSRFCWYRLWPPADPMTELGPAGYWQVYWRRLGYLTFIHAGSSGTFGQCRHKAPSLEMTAFWPLRLFPLHAMRSESLLFDLTLLIKDDPIPQAGFTRADGYATMWRYQDSRADN
jgi:hypothetical protein